MSLPLNAHLDAVHRTLTRVGGDAPHEGNGGPGGSGGEQLQLTLERVLESPVEQVWAALVTPDRVARWLVPVTGELAEGGSFELEGGASGEVVACVEAERFTLSWVYDGRTSRVEVSLRPVSEGTLLQLDHVLVPDAEWEDLGPSSVGIGWELSLLGLAEHLDAPDLARAGATEQLGDFLVACSQEWAEAAVTSGEDPARAHAAAARCVTAYIS